MGMHGLQNNIVRRGRRAHTLPWSCFATKPVYSSSKPPKPGRLDSKGPLHHYLPLHNIDECFKNSRKKIPRRDLADIFVTRIRQPNPLHLFNDPFWFLLEHRNPAQGGEEQAVRRRMKATWQLRVVRKKRLVSRIFQFDRYCTQPLVLSLKR